MPSHKHSPVLMALLIVLFLLSTPVVRAERAASDDFIRTFGEALAEADNASVPTRSGQLGNDKTELLKKAFIPLRKFLETVSLATVILVFPVLLSLITLLFTAFSLAELAKKEDSLGHISALTAEKPWKSLILGLVNGLLAVVITAILLRPGLKPLGILFLAWFISKLLKGLTARALDLGKNILPVNDETEFPKYALAGPVVLTCLFVIPVYGQVLFITTLLRGLGAIVWLELRRRMKPAEVTES